jgi:hypothetical protein
LDWATGPLWKVDRTARVGSSEGFASAQISSLDKPLHHHRAMTHASGGEIRSCPRRRPVSEKCMLRLRWRGEDGDQSDPDDNGIDHGENQRGDAQARPVVIGHLGSFLSFRIEQSFRPLSIPRAEAASGMQAQGTTALPVMSDAGLIRSVQASDLLVPDMEVPAGTG